MEDSFFFFVPPPILSPLVDGSSNHHDWLTFRLVSPLGFIAFTGLTPTPNTPTNTPSREASPEAGQDSSPADVQAANATSACQNLSRWFNSVGGSLAPTSDAPSSPPTSIKKFPLCPQAR